LLPATLHLISEIDNTRNILAKIFKRRVMYQVVREWWECFPVSMVVAAVRKASSAISDDVESVE